MSKARKLYNLVHVEPKGYIYVIGNHRYGLEFRLKNKKKKNKESVAVIQMNGSSTNWDDINTQGHWKADSTIGKVLCWCGKRKYDVVHCLNLWSYVDNNPSNLTGKSNDILNELENDLWIEQVLEKVDIIILAYGDCLGVDESTFKERKKKLKEMLLYKKSKIFCVGGLNESGNPKHGRVWNDEPELNKFNINNL
ncbi:DUF1643 domain-containing protein [Paenibacillus silvae]|uniref:DUF1643 domain-containing protein n=1 Tax=Paenibacillus silvae TaxID=1325358 RepID=UPI0020056D6A|nr:DUF1643 domain-containing protein [Paenibacillus silvae]MCK6075391.1 DUF1643 domain-containing protein [Paenibacillus silvae]MCK6149778.1 DUF1643 domain-containing protein [Paenibacillus silvae]MCK6268076.1 DUF1643 domain-containing protein [Paenibacillus silvae]